MNEDASKLFETMLRKRLFVLGAVVMLSVVTMALLWIFAKRESDGIHMAARKRTEIFRGLDTIANLTAQKNASNELFELLNARMPQAIDAVVEIPQDLRQMADDRVRVQVDIGELKSGGEGEPSSIGIRVKVDGTLAQVLAYAKRIEQGTYFYAFDQFEISPLGDQYQLHMTGRAFVRQ